MILGTGIDHRRRYNVVGIGSVDAEQFARVRGENEIADVIVSWERRAE
jgi:hypothetical protein